jgi:hypothetical protein
MRCGVVLIHGWEFACLSVRVYSSTGYMYLLIRRRWDGMSGMCVRVCFQVMSDRVCAMRGACRRCVVCIR